MNLRGLFPSLGAGGSLIAAALCALVVLGGMFAFRGESPGTAQAKPKDLALRAGAVRARTASAASPAPARVTRRGRTATTRPTAAPATKPPRTTTTPAGAAPSSPTPSSPGPTSGAPAPRPRPVAAPAGTVTRVVRTTRALAAPVIEAAPAPVQAPVNAAGDTVEQAAGAVDGLLER